MKEPTNEELAYIAGFFDGEGCIYANYTKISMTIGIAITNTRIEILEWIREFFDGSYIQSRVSKNDRAKDPHRLVFTKNIVIANFINSIYPYLILKREQADVARMFLMSRENQIEGPRNKSHYLETNLLIFEALRRLNKKGK
jgi:hypothetical protein